MVIIEDRYASRILTETYESEIKKPAALRVFLPAIRFLTGAISPTEEHLLCLDCYDIILESNEGLEQLKNMGWRLVDNSKIKGKIILEFVFETAGNSGEKHFLCLALDLVAENEENRRYLFKEASYKTDDGKVFSVRENNSGDIGIALSLPDMVATDEEIVYFGLTDTAKSYISKLAGAIDKLLGTHT